MKKFNNDEQRCLSCIGYAKGSDCFAWLKEVRVFCSYKYEPCTNGRYYANAEDVKDMVAWSVAGGLIDVFKNCLSAAPEDMEAMLTKKKRELLRGMVIDETGTETEITGDSFITHEAVPEFRVGDAISIVQAYRGEVVRIHDEKHSNTPITVKLKDGYISHLNLNLKGEITAGCGRKIYHGHDLEVSVKEKLPVRPKKTREAWVVLTSTYDPGCISHLEFKTELAAIDYCTKHFGIILSNPIKVEVPE